MNSVFWRPELDSENAIFPPLPSVLVGNDTQRHRADWSLEGLVIPRGVIITSLGRRVLMGRSHGMETCRQWPLGEQRRRKNICVWGWMAMPPILLWPLARVFVRASVGHPTGTSSQRGRRQKTVYEPLREKLLGKLGRRKTQLTHTSWPQFSHLLEGDTLHQAVVRK